MGWFGRKKDDEKEAKPAGDAAAQQPGDADGGTDSAEKPAVYSPEKAAEFFKHAQVKHDTGGFEYAMQLWLGGLRLDPPNMKGLEGFFGSTKYFLAEEKPISKDVLRLFSGRGDVERYLTSLLNWGLKPSDALLAVRAAEAAAKLNLAEATYWIGERALGAVASEKKPRKELFLKLMDVFNKIGAFDRAVIAGEAAVKLDPSDGRLAADVRNLSAQATMNRGGFDQTGQAGGFKSNIRDAEKQRQLEEQERIVKTEETLDRVVRLAEEDYRSRPDDPSATTVVIQRLMERGRPEDLKRARDIAKRGFEVSKQFRFRQIEGDITLRIASRKLSEYKDLAEKSAEGSTARRNYEAAKQQFAKMEIDEYKARVEAYPTDLGLKFELGRRLFALGDTDNSIPLFQESQHDAKRRVDSQNYLAQAFFKIDYLDESINTFRQAIETYKIATDEMGLGLRYGLMMALQAKAEKERDLPSAEEADKLASAISVQQFNYRDVRTRRDVLKKLISEIRRGGEPANT